MKKANYGIYPHEVPTGCLKNTNVITRVNGEILMTLGKL